MSDDTTTEEQTTSETTETEAEETTSETTSETTETENTESEKNDSGAKTQEQAKPESTQDLTTAERDELNAARERLQQLDVEKAVQREAGQLNIKNPALIADLVNAQRARLSFKNGTIGGLSEVIADIKTRHPDLFEKTGKSDAEQSGAATVPDDGNAWFRNIFKK